MNKKSIRVRFAPSPTGHLHIGSLRVAIFNWLFARHHGGSYLLRVEDTDRERSKQEYADSILQGLAWCGIDHDGEPVLQASRIERHKTIVETFLKEGKAYRCYCTPEEIAARQKEKDGHSDLYSMYDGHCLLNKVEENRPHVVRFKVPREQKTITFMDLIRGPISFDIDQFDDFIISRSDGNPMYNLVVVIDDNDMGITQVIRGEDHISNTPKQIMLYQACGFTVPEFAHLPLILGPSGEKLSKRDAATSVLDYKKQDHVGKKGSIFDPIKLAWLNGVYMRDMDSQKLHNYILECLDSAFDQKVNNWDNPQIVSAIDLYKSRCKTVVELMDKLLLLHNGPELYEQESVDEWIKPETKMHLKHLIYFLQDISFNGSEFKDGVKKLCKEELAIKFVALAQPIRIALTGGTTSPGVFDLLKLLGKEESLQRFERFVTYLK